MLAKFLKISLIAMMLTVFTAAFAFAIPMEGQPAIDFKLPEFLIPLKCIRCRILPAR